MTTPDPDATISDAQEADKCLTDFHAFVASHDPYATASTVEDARATLERVATMQAWLQHYSDALKMRA
jgi:hypothetical protein